MTFIYIGQPYSSNLSDARNRAEQQRLRYLEACEYVVWLLNQGEVSYSPIVHCHQLALDFDLPKDARFWQKYNFAMLSSATEFDILNLPGAKKSEGLKGEIEHAEKVGVRTNVVNQLGDGTYERLGAHSRELVEKLR